MEKKIEIVPSFTPGLAPIQKRDYQERLIQKTIDAYDSGIESVLIESPTGSGKTITALLTLKKLQETILKGFTYNWVAMRSKLLKQAAEENKRIGVQNINFVSMFDKNPPKCDMVVTDEAQHDAAASCADIHKKSKATHSLGLSVGGDSRVLIRDSSGIKLWRMDEFIDTLDVTDGVFKRVSGYYIRAFDGKKFVEKPLKAVLKHHIGSKKCYRIKTEYGRDILVTEDHSVFRVKPGKRKGKKFEGVLENVLTTQLNVGDFLLQEDFIENPEECSDFIFMPDYVNGNRWKVAGDFLEDIEHLIQKPHYKNAHKVRYMRKHGKYGPYLTNKEYKSSQKHGTIYHDGPESWCKTHVPVSAIAYLLGQYLGDGWVDGTRSNFAVNKKDAKAFIQKLQVLEPFFYINPKLDPADGDSYEIRISNKYLSDFFRSIPGRRSWTKSIPDFVYEWSNENIRLLLQGLIDSDGHLSRKHRDRYYITTTSKNLAHGLLEILKRFGVVASISTAEPKKGGVIRGRQIQGKHKRYAIHFSKHALDGNNSGVFGRRHKFIQNFSGQPTKILSITEEKTKYVYDFSVDDDKWQTFVASGFLVHNTATPFRTDRMKLGYKKVIKDFGVRFLINEGWLSKFDIFAINEWTPKSVAYEFAKDPKRWGSSVAYFQTDDLCNQFIYELKKIGVKAAFMSGSDSLSRRDEMFEAHEQWATEEKAGNHTSGDSIQVLVNIHLLTEGFDAPYLKTALVRDSGKLPTMQMAGRALRLDPGDPNKTAQIMQSTNTRFTYTKVASPRRQYILQDDQWRVLGEGQSVDALNKLMYEQLLTKPVELPVYLQGYSNGVVKLDKEGKIKRVKNKAVKRRNDLSILDEIEDM